MTTDTTEPKRAIQTKLESARSFPGHYRRTLGSAHRLRIEVPVRRKWPCGDCRSSWSPAWITEAKSALGRHGARDSSWLIDWQERDGRSLGDLSKMPVCSNFVETCIRVALPDEPLLGALGSNPYWAGN